LKIKKAKTEIVIWNHKKDKINKLRIINNKKIELKRLNNKNSNTT